MTKNTNPQPKPVRSGMISIRSSVKAGAIYMKVEGIKGR